MIFTERQGGRAARTGYPGETERASGCQASSVR